MKNTIRSYLPELVALRRDIHKHPELGFEEERTSGVIAGFLEEYGVDVHRGWANTGIVGALRSGSSPRTVALRADMDALPVLERTDREYRSVNEGVMHACGHDGHIAMLLGAARYLAQTRKFDGTVLFLFQPAEEGGGGGRLMVEEGIVEEFNIQAIYGMHNRSGLEAGRISTRTGPIMAATDNFDITIHGVGTHAALPHSGVDPIVAASQLVGSLQSIVTREIKALDSVVISITQFSSGTTYNVIPDDAVLKGCTRYQAPETGNEIKEAMERVIAGISSAHSTGYTFQYIPGYPSTVNTPEETGSAARAAARAAGPDNVDTNCSPLMASEDFSYFLKKVPGCYVFIGNGASLLSHHSDYDFNDDIIPVGVTYWSTLVEQELGEEGAGT